MLGMPFTTELHPASAVSWLVGCEGEGILNLLRFPLRCGGRFLTVVGAPPL